MRFFFGFFNRCNLRISAVCRALEFFFIKRFRLEVCKRRETFVEGGLRRRNQIGGRTERKGKRCVLYVVRLVVKEEDGEEYEEETYEELNRKLPNVGDQVTTKDGQRGEVQSINILRQLVKVIVENGDEKEIQEYPVDELRFKRRQKKDRVKLSAEEMKELEKLEKQDKTAPLEG